ncbi:MAG: nucleotidyl transferase AbiEii/AbiGii toxin family protein [Vicinamibacterales bacterium]
MTALEATLHRVANDLAELEVPFALVGGLAVSARTEPRFTRDADLAVAVADDAAAEALIRDLHARGYHIEALVEQDAVGRLATARLLADLGSAAPIVDLLFASSGIEPEVVRAAEVVELLPGLHLRLATTGHLIALKVLARDDESRPQDLGDLRALLRVASPTDVAVARAALEQIAARGYGRQRDLQAGLADLLEARSSSA